MIIWLLLSWQESEGLNQTEGSSGQKENDMKESGRSSRETRMAFNFFFIF